METKWSYVGERALSIFKYFVAFFMMLVGVLTPLQTPVHIDSQLGFLYESKWSLGLFGLAFFISGATLFYGKVMRSKRWTGRGLFYIFACFLFAAILDTFAQHTLSVGNFFASAIMASLYLRWRFKTAYIDPNHFVDDIDNLTPSDVELSSNRKVDHEHD